MNCVHSEDVYLECGCEADKIPYNQKCRSCSLGGKPSTDKSFCVCPANHYYDAENHDCKQCPDNSTTKDTGRKECFCDAGLIWNNNRCISCPKGQYSSSLSNICRWCPPNAKVDSLKSGCLCPGGLYWDSSTFHCRACLPNTYSKENTSTCNLCPQGSSSNSGSSYCKCPPGKYWDSDVCKTCSTGSYSYGNDTFCRKCPQGSISKAGADSCSCHSGLFWDVRAMTCGICMNGTYSEENSKSCIECPNNTYSYLGADHCICPPGRYWRNNSCYLCPSGTYSRKEGSLICIPCPKGSTSSPGSASCKCNSQELWDEYRGSCAPCPYNSYYDSDAKQCRQCLNVTISNGTTCLCPNGMYMSGSFLCEHIICDRNEYWNTKNKTCVSCPNNTISDGGQVTSCFPCTKGTRTSKTTGTCICDDENKVKKGDYCEWCPNNYFALNGSCVECPDNMYSPISVNYCSCPVGYYLLTNGTCAHCPDDQYSNHINSTSCSLCPNNSLSTGVSCQCKPGYTWENGKCKPCGVGFYSTFSGECARCPHFQTSRPASVFCSYCNVYQFWKADYTCENCSKGTVGDGIMCTQCPEGSVSIENFCISTGGNVSEASTLISTVEYLDIIVLGSIGTFIIIVIVLICVVCRLRRGNNLNMSLSSHSKSSNLVGNTAEGGMWFENKTFVGDDEPAHLPERPPANNYETAVNKAFTVDLEDM